MRRSVHPSAAGLAKVASHGDSLRDFVCAIDGVGTHGLGELLLAEDARAGLDHGRLARVTEVLSCLSVALTCGVADDIELLGDVTRVSWDFLSAVHGA